MIRVHVEVQLQCDAIVGSDPLGPIYCSCRSRGRGTFVETAIAEAQRKAVEHGWRLTAQVGRDLCSTHAGEEVDCG